MSTRCQVKVTGAWQQAVTLYHHTDGYPSFIVPLIRKAHEAMAQPTRSGTEELDERWRMNRAGKVASYLCFVDPGVFEPEVGHALHGDIEWYYTLDVSQGHAGWQLGVHAIQTDGTPKLVQPSGPLGAWTVAELESLS